MALEQEQNRPAISLSPWFGVVIIVILGTLGFIYHTKLIKSTLSIESIKPIVQQEILALKEVEATQVDKPEETQPSVLASIDQQQLDLAVDAGIARYIKKQQSSKQQAQQTRQKKLQDQAKTIMPLDPEKDHVFGKIDAPITIFEYSDFECPYCKQYHPNPKKLVERYPEQVNWVYRHYPLPFHNPTAEQESQASECAAELGGNESFWQYSDEIFTRDKQKPFSTEVLADLAVKIGLDKKTFTECVTSGRYKERVQRDLAQGKRIGITGTPTTIFRNNKTGIVVARSGAIKVSQMDAIVKQLINGSESE